MIWGVEPRAGKDQECAWGAGSCPGGCTARWGLWWAAALGATQHEVGVALEMGPVPNRGTWPLRGSMCGGTGPPAVTGPARAADGAVAGQAAGWWLGAALDPSGDLSSLGIPGEGGSPVRTWGWWLGAPRTWAPVGQRPQHLLCKLDTFIWFFFFFFKSQLPNCGVLYSYGRAGLSLPHYGTAQPQLYKPPGPVPSGDAASPDPAPPGQLRHRRGWLWGACPVTPHVPPAVGAALCWEQAARRLLRVSISA